MLTFETPAFCSIARNVSTRSADLSIAQTFLEIFDFCDDSTFLNENNFSIVFLVWLRKKKPYCVASYKFRKIVGHQRCESLKQSKWAVEEIFGRKISWQLQSRNNMTKASNAFTTHSNNR